MALVDTVACTAVYDARIMTPKGDSGQKQIPGILGPFGTKNK